MPATPCSASFLSCYPSPVSLRLADERADTQRQLEQTQKDIGELKKLLDGIQQEKSGAEAAEVHRDRDGRPGKQIKALQDELDKSEAELKRLDGEKTPGRAH